jgi:D-tyrosyl-tRNA(Tyr) deacylase
MIGLLQRVSCAEVLVEDVRLAEIGKGLVVLVAVERGDTEAVAERLAERLLRYRVFPDSEGRMNLSVEDAGGSLMVVPQFTLAADTDVGNRPSFGRAATPSRGRELFDYLVGKASQGKAPVTSGRFGANMQVTLTNDGPVTFWLRVAPRHRPAPHA